jgi:formylglycine-generating enzyme required for sulfatase activity
VAGKVFINYRRDDSASEALNIAQYFEGTFGKGSIFIDVDRLHAGQKFATVLGEKLWQCKVMLAIIGPNWVDARDKNGNRRLDNPEDWVRVEIEQSLARNVPVIPVLIGGAMLPSKSDLPQSLWPLIEHQCATVTTNGFRYEMAGLARDVTELMGRRALGRIAVAASALLFGSLAAAYFGAPVLWPSLGRVMPNEPATAGADAKRNADYGASEAKRKAEEAHDPVRPSLVKTFQDPLADGSPCSMCPKMVVVPAGDFQMGAAPSDIDAAIKEIPQSSARRNREAPQHTVSIPRPFAVGSFAVTFAEWDACFADGGCNGHMPNDAGWGRGNLPVINVNWEDANNYAAWLSRKTGKPYRLMSEAEYEYAARAGTTTPFWWGQSISTRQANYNGGKTVPVDSFEPNPWGLYQVHGNVFEWVEDCWHESYQDAPSDGSAWTTACTDSGRRRPVRGGSWTSIPRELWAAARTRLIAADRHNDLGFRVARTLDR